MSASGGDLGDDLDLNLLAMEGDLAEIYLSTPWGPLPGFWPNSGMIWIRFNALAVLGRFQIPAGDQVDLSLPIPDHPVFQGFPLTFQALTVSLQNGWRFSAPVTPVLN